MLKGITSPVRQPEASIIENPFATFTVSPEIVKSDDAKLFFESEI